MSSHLVKKFFLHALAWKQVLFVGLAYKKYSYVRCNVVFTSEKTIHSHTITLLFSLIILIIPLVQVFSFRQRGTSFAKILLK